MTMRMDVTGGHVGHEAAPLARAQRVWMSHACHCLEHVRCMCIARFGSKALTPSRCVPQTLHVCAVPGAHTPFESIVAAGHCIPASRMSAENL